MKGSSRRNLPAGRRFGLSSDSGGLIYAPGLWRNKVTEAGVHIALGLTDHSASWPEGLQRVVRAWQSDAHRNGPDILVYLGTTRYCDGLLWSSRQV